MRWLAVGLILLYCATGLRLWGPLLHYRFFRAEYLAKCQNLNRPQLHCEGKCVLGKKLAELRQQAAQAASEVPPAMPVSDMTPHLASNWAICFIEFAQPHVLPGWQAMIVDHMLVVPVPPPKGRFNLI